MKTTLITAILFTAGTVQVYAPETPIIETVTEIVEVERIVYVNRTEPMVMEATAYTAFCEGCTGITYGGSDVRGTILNPDGYRIVAADKKILPLGTLLYIDGFKEVFIVDDIGSAIKGQRIDILMENKEKALNWGRRKVNIKILN